MIDFKEMPKSVKLFIQHFDAWIVGSAADPSKHIYRDIDVIIPFSKWNAASGLIPADCTRNTYGGWNYVEGGITVDVWPDDLNNAIRTQMVEYIWQPKYKLLYKKEL